MMMGQVDHLMGSNSVHFTISGNVLMQVAWRTGPLEAFHLHLTESPENAGVLSPHFFLLELPVDLHVWQFVSFLREHKSRFDSAELRLLGAEVW